MFHWFKKRPRPPTATVEEREGVLLDLHPLFRPVDAAFQAYVEILLAHPRWDDHHLAEELRTHGVEPELAQDVVAFSPLAFGREILQKFKVSWSEDYRLHNLADGSERELPLADEMAYVWARGMIELYRTPERAGVFKLIARRSGEVGEVDKILARGSSGIDLVDTRLGPSLVYLRRAILRDRRRHPNWFRGP